MKVEQEKNRDVTLEHSGMPNANEANVSKNSTPIFIFWFSILHNFMTLCLIL